MKREVGRLARQISQDESGAVVVMLGIMIVAMVGLAALAIDLGNLVYAQTRLQAVTDLSAQAGATVLTCSSCATNSAIASANSYSGALGSRNAQPGLVITMASGYPQTACVNALIQSTTPIQCTGATAPNPNANLVIVQEQTQVPFLLGQIFGFGTVTLSATSYAAKGGGLPPMNIMVVLDETGSMGQSDPGNVTCGTIRDATQQVCALAGIQTLLTELWPTQDQIGLMVFPPLSTSSGNVAKDYTCGGSSPTVDPYYDYPASATYLLLTPQFNYKQSNNSTTLNDPGSGTTSTIVNATCHSGMSVSNNGVTSTCGTCTGVKAPNGNTYLGDAITAAQAELVATNQTGVCANYVCQNVMIVLSDGAAGDAPTLALLTASQPTLPGGTVLTFAPGSVNTSVIVAGTSVADLTSPNTSAIPPGTQVTSATTSSGPQPDTVTLNTALIFTGLLTPTGSTTTTLTFSSTGFPTAIAKGMPLNDTQYGKSCIKPGTIVKSVSTLGGTTTVTLSSSLVTGCTVGTTDTVLFGGVSAGAAGVTGFTTGDQIAFGGVNQCHASVAAAQAAANAGTWVYAIAYGSGINLSPPAPPPQGGYGNTCTDNEGPPISACQSMQAIANSPGNIPDPSKFFSDPMGNGCTSPFNPNITSLSQIFANLGFQFTALLPQNLNLAVGN
jgi:Flp pilus assembly protein TadG